MTEKREEETVSPALQEIYVRLKEKGDRGQFLLPRAIVNYYELGGQDGLVCELIEVRDNQHKEIRKVKKEILVDVRGTDPPMGEISGAIWDSLGLKDGYYALLRIKQAVKKK